MRSIAPAEITQLQSRAGLRVRLLVWIVARDRATDEPVAVGFWNGDDDQEFVIGAEPRTYHGAGGLLGADDVTVEAGLQVRMLTVWLATAAPEVIDAVRGYDVRLAPVEVHRVLTDPLTHLPVAAPHRIWKGWVDGAPEITPAIGGEGGRIGLAIASGAMALTRGLTGKYSDESMKRRAGDRMFRWADVSGKVAVYWGEKRLSSGSADKDKSGIGSRLGSAFK